MSVQALRDEEWVRYITGHYQPEDRLFKALLVEVTTWRSVKEKMQSQGDEAREGAKGRGQELSGSLRRRSL